MPWIKKNLTLVLGGLIGLVLLGGSAFFLFSQSGRESAVNTALEEKKADWIRLNGLSPYPEEKNIKSVKEEAARVQKLSGSLKESLRPVEVAQVSDTYSLKLLIETTVSRLKHEAEEAGVSLPDRYAFTFQRLREMPQFESNGIPALAEQVSQISTLCRVLYDAKVHSLDTLRRSPVLKEEGGSSDYLTKKPATNQWVVRAPFDLSFKCFSGELSEVVRGFATLDQCIAIKTLNIEPTSLPAGGGGMPVMPMPMPIPSQGIPPGATVGPGGMDPALAQRYGLGPGGRGAAEGGGGAGALDPALAQRYGIGGGGMNQMRSRYGGLGPGAGPGTPAPTLSSPGASTLPAAPPAPSVVIDEKPLRVIVQLDFVKPKPQTEAARRTPRPTSPDAGSADPGADATATPAPEQSN